MNALICFYCGNGPTPTQSLAVGANGRLRHVWQREQDDDSSPLCPPVPSGWGVCDYCEGAFAAADMYKEHSGASHPHGRFALDRKSVV